MRRDSKTAKDIDKKRSFFRKLLKWVVLPLIGLLTLLVIGLLAFRAWAQHRVAEETKIASPNGISSLETITLGGVEQWILIRGHDRSKPVLLFLHGGPGVPEMPFSHVNADLEKSFVVVQWDQRGAGKSWSSSIPKESMTIEQFVSDTHELVEHLRARFKAEKIYLVGFSWGSIVGVQAAARWPELFHAYVGVGQVTNTVEIEKLLYAWTVQEARQAGNQRALKQLAKVQQIPWPRGKDCIDVCRWHYRFRPPEPPSSSRTLELAFTSPYYSLADLYRMGRGMWFSFDQLWSDITTVDLFTQVPRLDVPIYFLQSRDDYVVTAEMPERYFQALIAPRGKQMIWFENSGHMLQLGEPEKYRDVLVNKVLKETRSHP